MIDRISIDGVVYALTPTTAPALGDKVITVDGVIYVIGDRIVEAVAEADGEVDRTRVNGNTYDLRDKVILPQVNTNARAIANEVTRATAAEKALSDRIDNIPTGGGGTGDIADGAVTERKLSTEVQDKLNTAYNKANLADTLYLNDGIVFKKGVLVEDGVRESVTGYAYTNKILANGETITVADGYKIVNFKLYDGEEELYFNNDYNNNTITLEEIGYSYQFSILKNDGIAIGNYNNIVKSFIRNPYAWDSNSNLNNFTCQGNYTISGTRQANAQDGMPIYNGGKVEAKLQVLEADNCIMQILTLLNVGGGDGNIYTRVRQNGSWSAWGKLQANIEVGRVEGNNPFDDFTDNGMYSGVYAYDSTAETFVLVVINAYLYGGGVAQLKYSTLLDGTTEVKLRTRVNGAWGEWKGLGGGDTSELLEPSEWVGKLNTLSKGVYEFYGSCTSLSDDSKSVWDWADGYRFDIGDPVYLKMIIGSKPIVQVIGAAGSATRQLNINNETVG